MKYAFVNLRFKVFITFLLSVMNASYVRLFEKYSVHHFIQILKDV